MSQRHRWRFFVCGAQCAQYSRRKTVRVLLPPFMGGLLFGSTPLDSYSDSSIVNAHRWRLPICSALWAHFSRYATVQVRLIPACTLLFSIAYTVRRRSKDAGGVFFLPGIKGRHALKQKRYCVIIHSEYSVQRWVCMQSCGTFAPGKDFFSEYKNHFAKNSDRLLGEAQPLAFFPGSVQ